MGRLVLADCERKAIKVINFLNEKGCNTVVPWVWKFVVENNPFSNTWKTKQGKGAQLPSRTPILWIDEHQRIPGQLTDSLSHPPVLAYPDSELVFMLHVDASEQMQCIKKRMEKWGPLLMALELSLLLNKITTYNQGNWSFLFLSRQYVRNMGIVCFMCPVLQSTQTIFPSHGYCKAWCC